jgi:hypothetical protein
MYDDVPLPALSVREEDEWEEMWSGSAGVGTS